jgi:hypothetical protein
LEIKAAIHTSAVRRGAAWRAASRRFTPLHAASRRFTPRRAARAFIPRQRGVKTRRFGRMFRTFFFSRRFAISNRYIHEIEILQFFALKNTHNILKKI